MTDTQSDRRRFPRAEVSFHVDVWVDGAGSRVSGRLVVLGGGGAFLELEDRYPISSSLRLRFALATLGDSNDFNRGLHSTLDLDPEKRFEAGAQAGLDMVREGLIDAKQRVVRRPELPRFRRGVVERVRIQRRKRWSE